MVNNLDDVLILLNFASNLLEGEYSIDTEICQIIADNFWEML